MVFFITVLRALAACLITNAHYTGVYPTDLIANGGLIGDILFFAVSGYCLYNVKTGFVRWYGKRLWRIYPPVIIATAIYMMLGSYCLTADKNIAWWYVYPTYYHFVASILVLYIPYYIIVHSDRLKAHLSLVMSGIAIMWLLLYIFAYDKSYYHIDTVREPMIRFLFMEAMLLGAWFRQNDAKIRNHLKSFYIVAAGIAFVLYFISKIVFVKYSELASWQILNQIIIFILLYFIFKTFHGIDCYLEKMPVRIKNMITFVSEHTLEIYVVQYVLIDAIRPLQHFPLNWIAMTSSILLGAYLLHKICGYIYDITDRAIEKIRG